MIGEHLAGLLANAALPSPGTLMLIVVVLHRKRSGEKFASCKYVKYRYVK